MAFFNRRKFVPVIGRKSGVPDGLWMKCAGCNQAVFRADIEQSHEVCPTCGHHYRISARKRIEITVDPGSFDETHHELTSSDPLGFTVGEVTYQQKIDETRQKTGLNEAMITGFCAIEESRAALGVMDFAFVGGSMGSVVGEKFCRLAGDAIEHRLPLVVMAAGGGARMQEGVLSLMQMAKTAGAVADLHEAGVPYISVLTDPTSGGVWASFASLGDVTLAEPGAYVGFAGTRLIEGALKVKPPEGFQQAEYQFNNGFVDQIVKRKEMRPALGKLLRYLKPSS